MEKPLISVIVPVYNAEQYLDKCIQSILNQDFKDFNLILVDDGSTDNSGSICESYQKKDNRVIVVHKKNGGECSARNEGLKYANGEWIAFSDADDWVGPTWLSTFLKYYSSDTDLIVQGFKYSTERSFTTMSHAGLDYNGDTSKGLELLLKNGILGYNWCKLFRRDIIIQNHIAFDEKIFFKGDEEFVLKYLVYSKQLTSSVEGHYYYVMPNWESKYDIDNYYCSLKSFEAIEKIIHDRNNHVFKTYLQLLCNSYFIGFKKYPEKQKERTSGFINIVKKHVEFAPISIFTKILIKYINNHTLLHLLFVLKSSLSKS